MIFISTLLLALVNQMVVGNEATIMSAIYRGYRVTPLSSHKWIITPPKTASGGSFPLLRKREKFGVRLLHYLLHHTSAIEVTFPLISRVKPRHLCGAFRLSASWLITAAHCVLPRLHNISHLRVLAFNSTSILPITTHHLQVQPLGGKGYIGQVFIHPSFGKPYSVSNDIALVKTISIGDQYQKFHEVHELARLMNSLTEVIPSDGSPCFVAGFGRLTYSSPRTAGYNAGLDVAMITSSKCSELQQKLIDPKINLSNATWCSEEHLIVSSEDCFPSLMCAGGVESDGDACQGDSGGPLVCINKANKEDYATSFAIGLASAGVGCSGHGLPGMYTYVTAFRRWILSTVYAFLYTTGDVKLMDTETF